MIFSKIMYYLSRLRAVSHVEFRTGVKFSISTQAEKIGVTREF